MNALEAVEKLNKLNKRIKALNSAYEELWRDFDNRWMAIELNGIQADLEQERGVLEDKLRAFSV